MAPKRSRSASGGYARRRRRRNYRYRRTGTTPYDIGTQLDIFNAWRRWARRNRVRRRPVRRNVRSRSQGRVVTSAQLGLPGPVTTIYRM